MTHHHHDHDHYHHHEIKSDLTFKEKLIKLLDHWSITRRGPVLRSFAMNVMHRRDAMIRLGQVGLGALTLPQLVASDRATAGEPGPGRHGKAKACILIYLWGGPPQMDMWDPNPQAPDGVRSRFKPISTDVPGVQVCDQLPKFARRVNKTAIIRSLSHESNVHEPSVYRTLTGRTNASLRPPCKGPGL